MRVIIVGAGLAGLTCARVLTEQSLDVAVMEEPDGVRTGENCSTLSGEAAAREVPGL